MKIDKNTDVIILLSHCKIQTCSINGEAIMTSLELNIDFFDKRFYTRVVGMFLCFVMYIFIKCISCEIRCPHRHKPTMVIESTTLPLVDML